ncbi:hypothetical protein [Desulfonauticus submarinus]
MLIIICLAIIFYYNLINTKQTYHTEIKPLQIALPADNSLKLLQNVLYLFKSQKTSHLSIPQLNTSLFFKRKSQTNEELNIDMIFIGKKKFVLINNIFYTIGQKLPNGYKIINIQRDGIIIKGESRYPKKISWKPPLKIRLGLPNQKTLKKENINTPKDKKQVNVHTKSLMELLKKLNSKKQEIKSEVHVKKNEKN